MNDGTTRKPFIGRLLVRVAGALALVVAAATAEAQININPAEVLQNPVGAWRKSQKAINEAYLALEKRAQELGAKVGYRNEDLDRAIEIRSRAIELLSDPEIPAFLDDPWFTIEVENRQEEVLLLALRFVNLNGGLEDRTYQIAPVSAGITTLDLRTRGRALAITWQWANYLPGQSWNADVDCGAEIGFCRIGPFKHRTDGIPDVCCANDPPRPAIPNVR